jgi:hypothetical protein
MQKYRLDLDNIKVESFDTRSDALPLRGTVFGNETENYGACTGNYYSCDAHSCDVPQCGGVQTRDDENTCNLMCHGGGGGGGDSMHTACLNCYTGANTCDTCNNSCLTNCMDCTGPNGCGA